MRGKRARALRTDAAIAARRIQYIISPRGLYQRAKRAWARRAAPARPPVSLSRRQRKEFRNAKK